MSSSPDIDNLITSVSRKSVVVIGAGISGLCAAYRLKRKGMNVTVLESTSEAGGTMKTIRESDWLIETGPNSALDTTPLFQQLFNETGITEHVLYANEKAKNRYILRDGILHSLPTSVGSFLSSRLWTIPGKLRLLKEPFIGKARKEESVAEFVERRLGSEFLEYAINPFIAGVYAGNPRQLSVQAAFSKLYRLEAKYGGLMKGAFLSRKERRKRKDTANMFSFDNGMQTLPRKLGEKLGTSLKLDSTVERIIPMRAGKYPVYTISYIQNDIRLQVEANVVILATPAYATAAIIRPIDPAMAASLESIYYPPVAEVFIGIQEKQIKRSLNGFGFLVPEKEQRRILGCIWSSSLFPNRAPSGYSALTSFVGGSRQPELVSKSDDELRQIVVDELRSIMSIEGNPELVKIMRWERAIPQYAVGYHTILSAMDRFEQNFQGAFICSNYRGGISVGDCVMNAEKTANRVEQYLSQPYQ